MIYYTVTKYYDRDTLMNSLSKGRDDYFEMLGRMGLKRIEIPVFRHQRFLSVAERLAFERRLASAWRKALKGLGPGDTLVIHTPCSEKFSAYAGLIEKLRGRGCKIVTIVFELETFFHMDYRRFGRIKRAASVRTERRLFDVSDAIVVHNDVMKRKLEAIGIDGRKMFSVGVMDYLRDDALSQEASGRAYRDGPVIFAGNLSYEKSRFEYELPDGFRCDLYGDGYTGPVNELVRYKGTYGPLELMDTMEGSFGLVWDGDSVDACTGSYGDYLTFNNPHKIALYLASGIPVIVWQKAAMAELVKKEGCGIIVSSLREVPERIASLSDEEYEEMRLGACRVGADMRKGLHIERAVREALDSIKKNALIVFTREPEAGVTKTRMMPAYTPEQCAEMHECFTEDIEAELERADADIFVACTQSGEGVPQKLKRIFGESFAAGRAFAQEGAELGERMRNALSYALGLGYDKAVLIGTDIPEVDSEMIDDAFAKLDVCDAVLGPTADGGYWLIGMKDVLSEAFEVKAYGAGSVLGETEEALQRAGRRVGRAETLCDIDEPCDLAELRKKMALDPGSGLWGSRTAAFIAKSSKLSIIIPVYNESGAVGSLMDQLEPYRGEAEILFVDGGSTDGTPAIIADRFKVISCGKGRGRQLNEGALAASGDILLFLHCDSELPPGFIEELRSCAAKSPYGCFGVSFRSRNLFMLTNRLVSNHRAKRRGLPFGDQGVFMYRDTFFAAGMYPDTPVMEDYELARRLKRKGYRPVMAKRRIVTSDRRYGKGTASILKTEARMWWLRRLYRLGADPEKLRSGYRDVR